MSKVDKSLSEVFDVEPIKKETSIVQHVEKPKTELEDFDFVRDKLHELLSAGTEAFTTLSEIAVSEEKVSAFQALNEMMGKLSDISIKLLDIQEKKMKVTKTSNADVAPTQITNNSVFVGSTADLDKLLAGKDIFGETIDNGK